MSAGPNERFANVTNKDELEELAAATGLALHELTALRSADNDAFRTGTENHRRLAEWVKEQIEATGFDPLTGHKRDLHYALLSHGARKADGELYAGNLDDMDEDARMLNSATAWAVELELLPLASFPDRRSRMVLDASDTRRATGPVIELTAPGAYLPTRWNGLSAETLPWRLAVVRPSPLAVQPVAVEILCEKDTSLSVLEPLAATHGARLDVTLGYTGKGLAYAIYSRARADGRPRIVLWLSDADAKGEVMPIATARYLEWLVRRDEDAPPIYLDPVALTLEQVAAIEEEIGREIPRPPDATERAEGRVELNALPHFAPGWLEQEVERRLEELLADVDYAPMKAAEREVRKELRRAFAGPEERIKEIIGRAQELLASDAAEELREALEALEDELREAMDEAQEIADGIEIELPDPDVEELNLGSRQWLLAPGRSYAEQLNEYRRREPIHRRRPPLVIEERPGCEWCGADMTGRRSTARFCCDAHKKRATRARGAS